MWMLLNTLGRDTLVLWSVILSLLHGPGDCVPPQGEFAGFTKDRHVMEILSIGTVT